MFQLLRNINYYVTIIGTSQSIITSQSLLSHNRYYVVSTITSFLRWRFVGRTKKLNKDETNLDRQNLEKFGVTGRKLP